jgi:exosortase/archaeosortase
VARSTPPRFVTRTFVAALAIVAFVLTAAFVLVTSKSLDVSADPLVRSSLQGIAVIGLTGFGLAGLASVWLARTISRPIDSLSEALSEMTRTRTFDRPLVASGTSLEVDALTDAFNTMIGSIQTAEAEARRGYLDAIRALAVAFDARDPHRAGHAFVMRGPFRRMPEPVKGARREDRSRAPHPSCAGRR